ncbi:hypothetical protein PENSPDRAFT_636771 [Peniophora sp. CONT]|nr:hypothetical protein PENSPDRAFT_636771 [Peniophora sp. CONT]
MASNAPDLPLLLSRLGNRALFQFTHTGDSDDVDVAIRAFELVLPMVSGSERLQEKIAMLNMLDKAHNFRFANFGDIADLTHSVDYLREVADSVSDAGAALNNLAMALQARFDNLGNREDADDAISCLQSAIPLAMEEDAEFAPLYLNNLSNALRTRFERLGDMSDLSASITFASKAVELCDDDSSFLNNLGLAFFTRFRRLGDGEDLEAAALYLRRAVDLAAGDEVYKPHYMHTLGTVLLKCYEHFNRTNDLDKCIELLRQAVPLTNEHAIHHSALLSNLGDALCTRFEIQDDANDLLIAIESHRAAVACTLDDNPDKVGWLNNLAHALGVSFMRGGSTRDVEEALTSYRKAISLTDEDDARLPVYLGNLAATLSAYAEVSGKVEDLDESITLFQTALQRAPVDHADRPTWLDALGMALLTRHREVQDTEDLEMSIMALRSSVEFTASTHSRKAKRMHNLTTALFSRFERSQDATDINNAIALLHDARALTADEAITDQATYLSTLGLAYQSRSEHLGIPDDIENALMYLEQAVERTPEDHADKAGWLSNLALTLIFRYDRAGRDLKDIARAIDLLTRTAALTPGAHAKQAIWQHNIALALQRRYEHQGSREDFDASCAAYERAVNHVESSAFVRLHAALYWAELCSSQGPAAALPAYSHVISLIPSVAWLGQKIGARYEQLPRIGTAVSGAAAASIAVGDMRRALEWLDQGRSVVWSQLLALRSPVDELRGQAPDLAEQLEDVARALESAGAASRAGITAGEAGIALHPLTMSGEAQRHSKLAREYERLLQLVRDLPGFERFLRPKDAKELMLAAKDGPVVIINVHDSRSDALAVCPSGELIHISLPGLNTRLAGSMRERLNAYLSAVGVCERAFVLANDTPSTHGLGTQGRIRKRLPVFERVLGTLWICVVQPILSALEDILWDAALTRLPHVTWCTTGALAYLPLHAAGLYSGKETMNTSDFVVSSYTPSLSTLVEARRRSLGRIASTTLPSLLAVAQPNTPHQTPLPGTLNELRLLREQFHDDITVVSASEATVSSVLQGMAAHSWVHLACHGMQMPLSPTESAFALHDGHLSIAELMRTALPQAQFAFLSACQTATGDASLPDENVHLAAAMLAVGYGSVVGTSWSIGDEDAPVVADAFYERLLEDTKSEAGGRLSAAHALHSAVEQLREKIGERNFTRWVPFVHFGL